MAEATDTGERRWYGSPINVDRLPERLRPFAAAIEVAVARNPGFFVNRVMTGVELRVNVRSEALPERLRALLAAVGEQDIRIVEDSVRPQRQNLDAAVARLDALLGPTLDLLR